jgi:DNA-directed RNA polymerase I subunit RPA49
MSSQQSSKKRKRDPSPEARLEIAGSTSARTGPVLGAVRFRHSISSNSLFETAIFPALHAPPSTAFKCYSQKRPKNAQEKAEGEDILVVGESSSIEFVSNEEESSKIADLGCWYESCFLISNDYS